MFFFHFSVTPLVLVPGMFIFASQSWLTQVLVHGMVLPLLIFCKYQTCLRSYRPQTKFFAMWSLATFAFLFYIYQFHVVGILYWPKTVSPIENLILIGKYLYIKFVCNWNSFISHSFALEWFLPILDTFFLSRNHFYQRFAISHIFFL